MSTPRFRVRIGGVVVLDRTPGRTGVALRVADTERGLARLSEALGAPPLTLPHVTLLHPRNSRGAQADAAAFAAAEHLRLEAELVVDGFAQIEERDGVWRSLVRYRLTSAQTKG